jgi:acetyl esterase/lipase
MRPHLPRERAGYSAPADLQARRAALAASLADGNWRAGAAVEEVTLGAVRCLRFAPPGTARASVLHLHGGGFRIGSPEMEGQFVAALAARCRVEIVCPAYRLAPEHPFPAALIDALAVLTALRRSGACPLILSGDSAGGGLAASLAMLTLADTPRPRGLVLLSAWLDLTLTSPTYHSNAASDPLYSLASARVAAELYLQNHPPTDVLASPLLGSLADFPHTLVSIGEGEVLSGDGRSFCEKLRAADVAAELCAIPGMEHVAVTRNPALQGADETFERVSDFIDRVIRDA